MFNEVANVRQADEGLLDDQTVVFRLATLLTSVNIRAVTFVELQLVDCLANNLLKHLEKAFVEDDFGAVRSIDKVCLNVQVADGIKSCQVEIMLQLVGQFHHSPNHVYSSSQEIHS